MMIDKGIEIHVRSIFLQGLFYMKENCLLIFRSYLRHMVSPLQQDGERISIAFNF